MPAVRRTKLRRPKHAPPVNTGTAVPAPTVAAMPITAPDFRIFPTRRRDMAATASAVVIIQPVVMPIPVPANPSAAAMPITAVAVCVTAYRPGTIPRVGIQPPEQVNHNVPPEIIAAAGYPTNARRERMPVRAPHHVRPVRVVPSTVRPVHLHVRRCRRGITPPVATPAITTVPVKRHAAGTLIIAAGVSATMCRPDIIRRAAAKPRARANHNVPPEIIAAAGYPTNARRERMPVRAPHHVRPVRVVPSTVRPVHLHVRRCRRGITPPVATPAITTVPVKRHAAGTLIIAAGVSATMCRPDIIRRAAAKPRARANRNVLARHIVRAG